MSRENKSVHFEVKSLDEQGQITAYGSIFDNVDEGGDRMNKGAFTRTLKNSKSRAAAQGKKFLLPFLYQHDVNQPIGGWYDIKEDDKGLLCKGQIILETQRGKEVYELLKAGVLSEFSIIYDVASGGAHYDSKTGVRELTELRLFSVDVVTFAMNPEAQLVTVKNSQKDKPVDKTKPPQLKTLMEHYKEEQAEDLLEDWQDVFVCSLTCAIMDAFTIGDSPQEDISQALDAFKELVMGKFVAQAIECDLSGYLEENTSTYSYNSAESTLHNGSDDGYGYMSRTTRNMQRKTGRAISAANLDLIDTHVKGLHELADKAMKSIKEHMKSLHTQADDFATTMQGAEPTYAAPNAGTPEGDQEGKSYALALQELKALKA